MATFLDITSLQYFSSIFVFIFVWLVVYGILLYSKILQENRLVQSIIGLILALFVVLSPLATKIVQSIAPAFAILFVFLVLIQIASKVFEPSAAAGTEMELAIANVGGIFIILIIIVFVVYIAMMARKELSIGSADFSNLKYVMFHPTFLGFMLLFAIAIFTVALLAAKQK